MTTPKHNIGRGQCSIYFYEEEEESSSQATATDSHWVHYTADGQQQPENFADYTEGNAVQFFLGGKAYFAALLAAFKQAEKSIYITGWAVNWDAQLAEGVRLVDALLSAAQACPALKIYLLPWENPSQVENYAASTERVFAALNTHLDRSAFHVRLADAQSGLFFTHHQKCVIIDEKRAYLGGIDLAYGRYDDHYGLQADAEGRNGMNMYNPGIPPIASATGYDPRHEYKITMTNNKDGVQQMDEERRQKQSIKHLIETVLKHEHWQVPDASSGHFREPSIRASAYLNPAIQPRMPWQDYQLQIEGPAVDDLIKNFVLRWNSYGVRYPNNVPPLQTSIPKLTLPDTPSTQQGSCQVQVLRSAPLAMRQDEHKRMPQVVPKPQQAQNDILRSMQLLINKAEHYIYIENQYFISSFGTSYPEDEESLSPVANNINPALATWLTRRLTNSSSIQNPIAEWLGDKIQQVILSRRPQPFHLYIVLPVHPEGGLDDPSVVTTIHLMRQSLVWGSHSLLNRIRRSLWVKQQLEAQGVPRPEWDRQRRQLEAQCGEQYKDIDFSACDTYVTLLNLRDYSWLNGRPVTEQIYVHSKLMIVDDRYALVGSANINDRSLLGDRDSELAVLVSDTAYHYVSLDNSCVVTPCRNFARDLRQQAWRKWLGSAVGECAEALDKPALAASWQKIQSIARQNAGLYEQVFNFIPRDEYQIKPYDDDNEPDSGQTKPETQIPVTRTPPSIWPVLAANTNISPSDNQKMPFSAEFWQQLTQAEQDKNRLYLQNINGYFTALPIYWTAGENNLIPYNLRLIG